MNTPLDKNSAAFKSLREFAKEYCTRFCKPHDSRLAGDGDNLYDLPMGVKLQRFTGRNHLLLVGQFAVDGGSDNPRRVYTVEVTRADNTLYQWVWNVEVKEDERPLVTMTVPGSRCKAEYFGIKALKADLHRRVRRNECKVAGKKRRAAAAAERAAAAAKTETTN